MVIWTIGYEKQRIDRFIATLQAAGIRRVVDVRDVAWSHNPSYAKKKLEASLIKAGIGYTHLQALGNPKAGREAAKAGETDAFHDVFGARLAGDEARAALARDSPRIGLPVTNGLKASIVSARPMLLSWDSLTTMPATRMPRARMDAMDVNMWLIAPR